MMKRIRSCGAGPLATLLALACVLQACGSVGVRIVAPIDGSVGTLMPLDIELDINANALLATLEVRLNGVDISDQFAFGPVQRGRLRATADDVWAIGLMIE